MSSRIMLDGADSDRPAPEPQEPREQPPANDNPAEPSAPPASPEQPPPASNDNAGGEPSPEAAEPPLPPHVQQRLDRLTREGYEYRRRVQELEERFAQQQQQMQRPSGQADPLEQVRQEEREKLRQQDLTQRFNDACNTLYSKGREEYGGQMDEAVQALNAVGWGSRPDALAALTRLQNGHRVYRELAANLDNAARVLNLPTMDMLTELATMAVRSNGAAAAAPGNDNGAAVTQALAPIRPIGGTSRAPQQPLDKVSMAEYIRRRDRDERHSRIMR